MQDKQYYISIQNLYIVWYSLIQELTVSCLWTIFIPFMLFWKYKVGENFFKLRQFCQYEKNLQDYVIRVNDCEKIDLKQCTSSR